MHLIPVLPDNPVVSIAIDGSGKKWIATYGGGLTKYDDTNWTVYNESNSGLPDNFIFSLAIDGNGNKWIGTVGGGLAIYKDGGVVSVQENEHNKFPIDFSLSQNYPNPFNPTTKIRWQSPVSSHQKLKIYDVLGNEIATLVDEFREAGKYEIEFDGSNFSSGVYFYKMSAGDFFETKKFIILR